MSGTFEPSWAPTADPTETFYPTSVPTAESMDPVLVLIAGVSVLMATFSLISEGLTLYLIHDIGELRVRASVAYAYSSFIV
jgi:hypothetical protein